MQFVAESAREKHFMLKSVLLRPLYLEAEVDSSETRHLRILRTYQQLCTPATGDDPWQALGAGSESPGPFERGWRQFIERQKDLATSASRTALCTDEGLLDLWRTKEVQIKLNKLGEVHADGAVCARAQNSDVALATVEEYCALETLQTAANFDGIAAARSQKPQRQIDRDQQVVEEPVAEEGGEDNQERDGVSERAQTGLGVIDQHVQIAHRFDPDTLAKILAFETAERTQAFVRELKALPIMSAGNFPPSRKSRALDHRCDQFNKDIREAYVSLSQLGTSLRNIVEIQ